MTNKKTTNSSDDLSEPELSQSQLPKKFCSLVADNTNGSPTLQDLANLLDKSCTKFEEIKSRTDHINTNARRNFHKETSKESTPAPIVRSWDSAMKLFIKRTSGAGEAFRTQVEEMLDNLDIDKDRFVNGEVASITERITKGIHIPTNEPTTFKPYRPDDISAAGDEVISWVKALEKANQQESDKSSPSIS